MLFLSTESSRHPEGELGRYCPKRQCAYSRGTVCSQMLGAHASTDCDEMPYPFRKGKTPTPKELDLPGLFSMTVIRSLGAVLLSTVCTDNLQAVQPATISILASRGNRCALCHCRRGI